MGRHSTYKGASVLVTGAGGFIGGHLCRHLNSLGARVTGTYLNNAPTTDDAEWIRLDLTDLDAVQQAIHRVRPEFIFHLAATVQGGREPEFVLPTFENNLAATVHLLSAAQEAGCCKRLVLSNSQEEPEPGSSEPIPVSPYAASKFAASTYARMFQALYEFPVVIARLFMVYGPGQKDHSKLIPYTILRALRGQTPELSSGTRAIDWIYVSDAVEGLLQLGVKSGIEGRTIDLGSGRTHTIRATVEEVLRQIDPSLQGAFGALPDRMLEQEPVADTEETDALLGWRTQVALAEGLAQTIAWYREHRATDPLSQGG
jgi:nucleoside-diphosphate-sugar epimerase